MADRDLTLSFFGRDVSAGAVAGALAAKLQALDAAMDDNVDTSNRLERSTERLGSRGFKPLLDTALLLGPAIVPIAAAATVAGVGLAGLGAAGLLAFTGIKKEMEEGTGLGKLYTAAFKPIVTEVGALQHIAAAGVFTGINAGIQSATTLFPGLNREIGKLSLHLGSIGGNLGATFVNIFRQLEPLFDTLASQLDRGSAALLRWSQSSDGVGKFIGYAQDQLPKVEETLGDLATALMHIAAAMAPLGGVALSAISNLANAIASIPVPVLTGLLVALQVGRILQIAKGLDVLAASMLATGAASSGFVAAGAGLLSLTAGFAALAVGAGLAAKVVQDKLPAIGVNINKLSDDTKKANTDFASSVTQFGADVAKGYEQGGDAAKQAGFQAAVSAGNIGELTTAIGYAKTTTVDFAVALTGSVPQWEAWKHQALEGALAAGNTGASVARLGTQLDTARQQFVTGKITGEQYAASLRAMGLNADGSVAGINNLTDAQLRGADAANAQKQSIMQLTQAISQFQSQGISAQKTQLGLNESLQHAKEQTDRSTGSLSANTDAGRKNQAWVIDQIGKINAISDATLQQTGSTAQATASLKTNEAALRRAAAAAGLNAGQVEALIQQYGNVPANVTTYLRTVDGASGVIRGVDGQLRALDGRVVYTTITTQHLDIYTVQDAAGNRGPAGVTAKQTGGWLNEGWNVINEAGPEWMLKRGGNVKVYPHGTGGPRGGGGGVPLIVNVHVGGSVVSQKDLVHSVAAGVDELRRRRGRVSVLDV